MTSNTSNRKSSAAAASAEPTLDEATEPTTATDAVPAASAETPAEVEAPIAADTPAVVEAPAPAEPTEEPLPANRVEVVLAHPIDKEKDLTRLRLEPKEGGYKPGDKIRVTRGDARSLINGGYAKGIDPENQAAVEALLAPAAEPTA